MSWLDRGRSQHTVSPRSRSKPDKAYAISTGALYALRNLVARLDCIFIVQVGEFTELITLQAATFQKRRLGEPNWIKNKEVREGDYYN